MLDTEKKYFGKVLLFGEYALIHGSPALARPIDLFCGHWDFDDTLAAKQAPTLNAFHAYCAELSLPGLEYQADAFSGDLAKGISFRSNIPIGYGAGSSGAVTAALFDQYFVKPDSLDLTSLRQILGTIESFFHGKSSGFDPLVCYLNAAVEIKDGLARKVVVPQLSNSITLFLLNTGMARETAPLVRQYLHNFDQSGEFRKMIDQRMIPLNQRAIRQTLAKDAGGLFQSFEAISRLQWKFFQYMIPANTKKIWEEGLTAEHYCIKLCGAGGGGFLLGLTKDMERTRVDLAPFECLELGSGRVNE